MERDLGTTKGWEKKKKMYRQIVKQLAFQLLTAFHVNVLDWHFLHIPAPNTPTHTHSLFFPSLLLQYTLCQHKNKREGQEESEWVWREWRWEGGEKNRGTGGIRLSPGLAEGQSWQARRLNCWVKILFIIIRSLFPNSPLLCRGQCPASTSPSPGFIRHCWAVRKRNLCCTIVALIRWQGQYRCHRN